MRAFLIALLAITVISVGAGYALNEFGPTTAQETISPNVRLD